MLNRQMFNQIRSNAANIIRSFWVLIYPEGQESLKNNIEIYWGKDTATISRDEKVWEKWVSANHRSIKSIDTVNNLLCKHNSLEQLISISTESIDPYFDFKPKIKKVENQDVVDSFDCNAHYKALSGYLANERHKAKLIQDRHEKKKSQIIEYSKEISKIEEENKFANEYQLRREELAKNKDKIIDKSFTELDEDVKLLAELDKQLLLESEDIRKLIHLPNQSGIEIPEEL